MVTTKLRKLGGSVVLTVPPAFLEQLHLQVGATVGLAVDADSLVVKPRPRPRYLLKDLLAESDFSQPLSDEDRAWIDAPAVGREEL